MRARLGVNAARQGNLLFLLYLGIFAASLLVGPLIDHLGNKVNLSVSSAIVAAAMVLFAGAHSFAAASVAAILLGLGGGGLNTCTNVLVSDLYGDKRGSMLNLLGIFFGIGAVCVPLFAASIEGHFTIPQLFLFCAVLAAGCALWYAVISFPPAKASQAFSLHDILEVAGYDGVLLLAFILFFESGNEACIGGWTSTYVDSTGNSPRMATLVLAAYWGALMLSRMLAARVLRVVGKSQLVVADCIDVIGGLRNLAVSAIAGVFIRRGSFDRIVLRPNLPNDAGHCGRPLFEAGGNGFWIAVFDCPDWRNGASLGRRPRFAESRRSRRHDCAVACSNRHCCFIRSSDVART